MDIVIDDLFLSTNYLNKEIVVEIKPLIEILIDLISVKTVFLNGVPIVLKCSEN